VDRPPDGVPAPLRGPHGEPFTLRTAWADAPMVLVSHPDDVRAIFTGDPAVLLGGGSGSVLEPFAGRHVDPPAATATRTCASAG
jgi:cytochrome P450